MKIHKLTTLVSCILAGAFLLSACSPPAPQQANSIPYPTANVGVSIANTTNPFFKALYDTYESQSQAQPSLTLHLESANNDQATQYRQYDTMIGQGAKALVINIADVAEGEAVINRYCGKVGLVFVNRNPGDKALAKCEKAYFVDGDAVQGGTLQGLKVLELWKENPSWDKNHDGKIQFAMLQGLVGHAGAEARTKWSISTMDNYPVIGIDVEQIFSDHANFDKEQARTMVAKWLTDPNFEQVEVILANNDTMALGASEALKQAGVKLPIFGIDATAEALNAVQLGDLTATVLNDAAGQAEVSLRMASNLASDNDVMSGIDYKLDHKTVRIPYQTVK
ncbi:galactose ABC transporter substrate-binding protein [Moraxella oblonga]|uniref:galactose ABC transporter substrate-binding protein n=1 Tax=Moraxella oblonga TaxID=200413 RepID=UPI00082B1CE3|nr:galactose ABC transporter substrate-binding protein [Moraxella oblonga]